MSVENALKEIGILTEVEVYLIGFLIEGGDRHPICIEPENGPWLPEHFASVQERARALYDADPEREIWHSDARLHEVRQAALRDLARSRAVREVLESRRPEITFFVGRSAPIEQHEVHAAIGLKSAILEAVPALQTRTRQRMHIAVSLLEATIEEILRLVRKEMHLPDPGAGLINVLDADSPEIVKRAARNLTESATVLAGQLQGYGLFEKLNQISTLRYERREGLGHLLLTSKDNQAIEVDVRFDEIPLAERRAVRKMLELSGGEDHSLLTDGRAIFGLGRATETYDPGQESVFAVRVIGEGTWELVHHEVSLLRVEFGTPGLPRSRIDESLFIDILSRVFARADGVDLDLLWNLTLAAADAEHGTMLVFSSGAANEAERLAGQSLALEPNRATPALVAEFSKIDGAILLDPHGTCHAIGVIVDGLAGKTGDRSRGARYNSAVRYLNSTESATAIVLVSEDGMVDVLPNLRPRIERGQAMEIVNELTEIEQSESPDFERFFRLFERLERLEFYMSAAECDAANAVRERMEERRWSENQMRISHRQLVPHAEMDESYFLD